MTVKYQVERRPIGPAGQVYRGTQPGDYIAVLTDPKHDRLGGPSGIVKTTKRIGDTVQYVPAGQTIPVIREGTYSHVAEISGEPWLVHSTHFSVESALESAAPLAGALGVDNVRIIKVISHSTTFNIK